MTGLCNMVPVQNDRVIFYGTANELCCKSKISLTYKMPAIFLISVSVWIVELNTIFTASWKLRAEYSPKSQRKSLWI